jgi:REP element-mobilizing transposase RayT
MGYARKSLISLQDTPYYHCIARCVRRAWLWGKVEYAGEDYSHRKQWVIDRLAQLCEIFAIEVCAYAVMSDHYHLVLYVDEKRNKAWSDYEVIERWSSLFRIPPVVERSRKADALEVERDRAQTMIQDWRTRLRDISWFMRCLNEHLARSANAEDECTGRFWEGRFKSQALLDEAGLLTAMAYVDLNPIRAGIASTPESSEFTSVYQRIKEIRSQQAHPNAYRTLRLRRFNDQHPTKTAEIPYSLIDYVQLLDWSGRAIRSDKPGHIDSNLPNILARLSMDPEIWNAAMSRRGLVFGRAMGRLDLMRLHAATLGLSWIRGLRMAERLFVN